MQLKSILFTSALATLAASLPQTLVPRDPIGQVFQYDPPNEPIGDLQVTECGNLNGSGNWIRLNAGYRCVFYL